MRKKIAVGVGLVGVFLAMMVVMCASGRASTPTKTDPGMLKNNGPSKCAGWSAAWSLVELALTISDETRGSSRVVSRSPRASYYREHRLRGSLGAPGSGSLPPPATSGTCSSTPAVGDARAGQAGAPQRPPALTLVRPRRRLTSAPTADILSRRAQQRSRTAGTPTERLARRFQAAP